MRKLRRLGSVALITMLSLVVTGLTAGTAGAGTSSLADPNDTTGLDLARVGISDDPYLVTFEADTFEAFNNETQFFQMRWDLDFDGDGVINESNDACILLEQNGSGGLRATLRDGCLDDVRASAEATKAVEGGGERVSFRFLNAELRAAGLGAGATSLRYRVQSQDLTGGNDFAPDDPTPTNTFVLQDHTGMNAAVVPQFTVDSPSVTEPDDPTDAGLVNLTFTVTMTPAIGASFPYQAEVDVATSNVTATASNTVGTGDYKAKTAHVVFDNDDTTKTVVVQVKGDTIDEVHETLRLTASNGSLGPAGQQRTGGAIAGSPAFGTGTITDNDGPTLSINDVLRKEGRSGFSAMTFTVTLSAASVQQVSVNYATADNKAIVVKDYTAANGTLTFAPGETTKTIDVLIKGDRRREKTETFFVNLTSAVNASISDAQGIGAIKNDDR